MNKKKNQTSKGVSNWKVLIGVLIGIIVLIAGFFLIKFSISFITNVLPVIGDTATQPALNMPSWLDSVFSFLLGSSAVNTVESFTISLVVFLMLLFAFGDMISQFTSFSDTTAWIIAVGLSTIAGVTNIVSAIVVWFGITAAVGALGIGVIIIGAILTAVALNLILQWSGVKGMWKERNDADEVVEVGRIMKKGFGKLKEADESIK
jgi:magnesium-transporting ATPase (P-type)